MFFWEKYNLQNFFSSRAKKSISVSDKSAESSIYQNVSKKSIQGETNNINGITKIVINPETGKEEIKIKIPKGKRLYDQEKMNEISSDANIDILTR